METVDPRPWAEMRIKFLDWVLGAARPARQQGPGAWFDRLLPPPPCAQRASVPTRGVLSVLPPGASFPPSASFPPNLALVKTLVLDSS